MHSLHTVHNPGTLFTTRFYSSVLLHSIYPKNTEQYIHAQNLDVRYLHNSHVSRNTFRSHNSRRSTSRLNEDEKYMYSDGGDHASRSSDVGEPGEETSEDTEKLVHRFMV